MGVGSAVWASENDSFVHTLVAQRTAGVDNRRGRLLMGRNYHSTGNLNALPDFYTDLT